MNIFARLLKYFNISENEYRQRIDNFGLGQIPNPFVLLDNFEEKIAYLKDNINKKIVIYGDYDVDGIMSTSIMKMALEKLGAKHVGYFIPSRYKEGYGLNGSRVKEFKEKGYELVITVDNGIAANEQISLARELGMDVFVIDHHEAKEELPNANYIIHQFVSHYVDYNISAAFLSLITSYGLLGYYDPYFVVLAGIAVISDMMPMKEANLALLKVAIKNLRTGEYPQFNMLLSAYNASFPIERLSYREISFAFVAPLNAIGRVCKGIETNNAVRFITATNISDITRYLNFILEVNDYKKKSLRELRKIISYDRYKNLSFGVVDNVQEGLIGAVISSELNAFKNATFLLTKKDEDDSVLVGSSRSKGLDLLGGLEDSKDLLLTYGGHKGAAGLSLKASNLENFKKRLIEFYKNQTKEDTTKSYIYLDKTELNQNMYDTLMSFGPFGTDFEEPTFIMVLKRKELYIRNNSNHIITEIKSEGNHKKRIIYFNFDEKIRDLNLEDDVYLIGKIKIDFFSKYEYLDFFVEEVSFESQNFIK